ncbi:HAMP domain-containing protein [Siculibacillus lacustris]|uniref:histidine kinase n=1 Tax=Siculibacillus lacustris TaxID=1549641 RepID=A0A4Q9VFR1_9HYPH|nr:ATP-binding protein [Siculibacillus lacustris]TBW33786.1 HAMP domain-containing protein [Siculibacillus lacustris]
MSGPAQRRWSLGRRLGVGLVLAVTVLWLAAATVAGLVLRREIDQIFDSALQEVAQRVLPLAYSELLSREAGDAAQHMAPIGPHREFITYVVRDGEGRDLLQSSDAEPHRIPKGLDDGFRSVDGLRLYTESAVRGTVRVTTVEALAHRDAAVRRAVLALVWPLAALVPVALIAVVLLGRATLRPILVFRREIEARGRGNLSPLAARGLPDEIAPIAGAVDALLDRLRGALEAERSFTANSAHELRTPIAAALAQAQRLIAEMTDETGRERARAVAASLRRLSGLSEKLLQLAKAEGGGLIAEKAAPLGPVLALVVEEIDRRFDVAERLDVAIPPDGGGPSDLDPDAFAVLARNLIENALKHGARDGKVAVRLGDHRFEVENDGPAVAPDRLERLTRRFERGPTTAEGSGLGLAIVAAVCRGAGLRLDLLSPIPGRAEGFLARVELPRSRSAA